MGVYIKGMEKRSCGDCPLVQYHATPTGFQSICYVTHKLIEDIDVTKDCPMVEVPELHGRLVDIDYIIRKYIDSDIEKFNNPDVKIVLQNLKANLLSNAPTVIEAEGKMNGFEKYMSEVDEKFLLNGYKENECGTASGVYSTGGVLTDVVTAYKIVTGRTISYDEAGKYVCMEIAKRWVDDRN